MEEFGGNDGMKVSCGELIRFTGIKMTWVRMCASVRGLSLFSIVLSLGELFTNESSQLNNIGDSDYHLIKQLEWYTLDHKCAVGGMSLIDVILRSSSEKLFHHYSWLLYGSQ